MEMPTLKTQCYILEKSNQILRIKINSYDASITLFNEKGVHNLNIKGREKEIVEILDKRVKYLEDYKKWKKEEPEEYLRQEAY